MATGKFFIVFVLPVVFSLIFGSVVLYGILQQPDRELNMWPSSSGSFSSHNEPIVILGLSDEYSVSGPVEIQIKVNDSSFDCGDLYVTIYADGSSDAITQGGFFKQCFEGGSKILPVGQKFSETIDVPGSYRIVAEMISKDLLTVSMTGKFTVK